MSKVKNIKVTMPIDSISLEKILMYVPLKDNYDRQLKGKSKQVIKTYVKANESHFSRWINLVQNMYRLKTNPDCSAPSLLASLIASGDGAKAYSVCNVQCETSKDSFTISVAMQPWSNSESVNQCEKSISYWLDKVSNVPYTIMKE